MTTHTALSTMPRAVSVPNKALLFHITTSKALVLHPQDIAWPERVETIGPSNPINTAQPPTALEAPQPMVFFFSHFSEEAH